MDTDEIVDYGVDRAPAVRVRYHRWDDPKRKSTAWVVVACPFCGKPHRHVGKLRLGQIVAAGCGATKGEYRISPVEVV